jgi:hypothetical protein
VLEAGRIESNHVEIKAEVIFVTLATILFLDGRV